MNEDNVCTGLCERKSHGLSDASSTASDDSLAAFEREHGFHVDSLCVLVCLGEQSEKDVCNSDTCRRRGYTDVSKSVKGVCIWF